jgi:prepilin signal peptidase PulO-like enzyme (type II secretory pathway)
MNSFSPRSAVQQVGLWCVLVMVVVLLTLLFTILGTITCAVLVGMMMAAVSHRRWQTIPVSLVFPGVILGMAQAAKVELFGLQRVLLPALCFGAFWLMYLSTSALIRFERRSDTFDGESPVLTHTDETATEPARVSERSDDKSPAPGDLRLEALQGKWSCETAGPNGETQKRMLEVVGSNLLLSSVDARGEKRLLARAELELRRAERAGTPATKPPQKPPGVPDGS